MFTFRYRINTKSGKVVPSQFPNSIKNRFINNFDFPTINEDYRGKFYCIVYGWTAIDYSRQVGWPSFPDLFSTSWCNNFDMANLMIKMNFP